MDEFPDAEALLQQLGVLALLLLRVAAAALVVGISAEFLISSLP